MSFFEKIAATSQILFLFSSSFLIFLPNESVAYVFITHIKCHLVRETQW